MQNNFQGSVHKKPDTVVIRKVDIKLVIYYLAHPSKIETSLIELPLLIGRLLGKINE